MICRLAGDEEVRITGMSGEIDLTEEDTTETRLNASYPPNIDGHLATECLLHSGRTRVVDTWTSMWFNVRGN